MKRANPVWNHEANFPAWPEEPQPHITKMVLGKLDADEDKNLTLQLPENFRDLFPNLKWLHLWGIKSLAKLPALPEELEELDVRQCPDLKELPELPGGLAVLVLEGIPAGNPSQLPDEFLRLVELSLQNSPNLVDEKGTANAWLGRVPVLRFLDIRGLTGLRSLPPELPASLEAVTCNDCRELDTLPEYWPGGLRRLELANTSVTSLPEFPDALDYLNLAGCGKLESIPTEWIHTPRPRTLFLHGSAVKSPPASQHGQDENTNVAEETRQYFRDKELVGEGQVKRCKVLLLGNGGAGKTTLNLALTGKNPKTDNPGTTHGIQFAPWPLDCVRAGRHQTILRHIWDLGGQEIYHNTHQLFMRTGAIFLLLWDPTQDGQEAPQTPEGYQDDWRPLRYWVDYLRLYGPDTPRMAVVCNCRKEAKIGPDKVSELRAEFERQMDGTLQTPPLFFVDAYEKTGSMREIEGWVEKQVQQVVETQGSAVPTYWETAQDMVEAWVEADSPKEMTVEEFGRELQQRLDKVKASPGKFHKLAAALKSGAFSLTEERTHRTLAFLTNSGWVYWDPRLFQERVIISQKWALEGIYAALDRRPKTAIFQNLRASEGRFTKKTLQDAVWGHMGLSNEQEDLLLSYMDRVGTCFTLIQAEDRWWKDAIYVSLAHLKTVAELGWQNWIDGDPDIGIKTPHVVKNDWLHSGHWNRILAKLGATYGRDAHYAKNGFYLNYRNDQTVLLRLLISGKGLGGRIELTVHAPTAERTAEIERKMLALISGELPTVAGKARPAAEKIDAPAGDAKRKIQVFVSYSWNPRKAELKDVPEGMVESMTDAEILNYEDPVDAIEAALKLEADFVDVLRDKTKIGAKDIVMEFIDEVKTCDRVLVVHSQKYWRSPYCMYEFWQTWQRFCQSERCIKDTFILVSLPDSKVFDDPVRQDYRDFWDAWHSDYRKLWAKQLTSDQKRAMRAIPVRLADVWPVQDLFPRVDTIFRDYVPALHRMNEYGKRWETAKQAEVIDWIKKEIGLRPPTPVP